jgi:TRL (tRNA-associated locus)-like protein
MSKTLLAVGLVLGAAMGGCGLQGSAFVRPPQGLLYSKVRAPLTTEFEATPVSDIEGQARTKRLYIPMVSVPVDLAWEDASMRRAAGSGRLSTVHCADYEFFNILCIFQEFTVIPNGEEEP